MLPSFELISRGPRLLLVSGVAVVLLITAACHAQTPQFKPQVVLSPPFPAIKDAPSMSAANAAEVLAEDELVLGVVVEGEAKAYPINMLTGPQREIINDTLGGRAIAATW